MLKVCMLSWHYQTPQIFLDTLLKMTPGRKGIWKNIQAVTNPEEADFCCVFDGYSGKVPAERTIYFGQHPYISKELSPAFRTWDNKEALLKLSLDKHLNAGEWWISDDYDSLMAMKFPNKPKDLACVMTYQIHNAMYSQRWLFMREFVKKYGKVVDLFGRPEERFLNDETLKTVYKGSLGYNKPDGTKGEHLIGKEMLKEYKYTVEFDVGPTQNYFSERFYDSILLWCYPVYFGSTNVSKWIPEEAFTNIDIYQMNHVDVIKNIIDSEYDAWRAVDKTDEARQLLLNKYQTFAYVHAVVNNLDHFKRGGKIEELT